MKEKIFRTHLCKELDLSFIGKRVIISGWVDKIRDHGGILFLDLRDTSDIIQVVSHDDSIFKGLTKESVITVKGIIRKRSEDTYNPTLKTGDIELLVDELKVLSKSKSILPFTLDSYTKVKEDIRYKYRYLDMRRKEVKDKIKLRSDVLKYLRGKMDKLGFTEVQTPILSTSSPEGARDFVVPSRTYKGKFFALPQAPQIYKELLMVGGLDKYYQIAPCFRDEDTRSDRTLEFYQLDFEMSFVSQDDVLKIGEEIFYDTFKKFTDKKISKKPFKRITYKDAMELYGTDKPDLRIPLIIQDATDILKDTSFGPFKKSHIKVIVVDKIGQKSSSWFKEIVDYATSIGMPGIGYITLQKDGFLKGPIDKFLTDDERKSLIKEFKMKKDSVMFFIADKSLKIAQKFAGLIRIKLGEKLDLIDHHKLEFCIITDFPMFEYDETEKKYKFCHNPFSMPQKDIKTYKDQKLEEIIAYQYDFVCDGYEMASGAIRCHDLSLLTEGFEIVGYKKEEIETKFKSIYTAFKYGCPPHGGMAPGIDRMLMLICDEPSLREVQAFPISQSGQDLMMDGPSQITEEQLKELGIKIE